MRNLLRSVLAAALLGAAILPAPAQARVFIGIGLPFPYYAPPPVYYAPPPVYYAPPPVYYAPPAYAAPAYAPSGQVSTRCNAGAYTCPLYQPKAIGDSCHCPANGSWTEGRVG